jgi:hypothetical protein
LLATIAIPIAVLKPASSTAPSTGATGDTPGAKLPAVSLDDSSIASSSLGTFKQKNPFQSHSDALSSAGTTNASGVPIGQSTASKVASANSTGSAAGGAPGSGSTSTSNSTSGSGGHTGLKYWVFTVDVSFGRIDHDKTYKGVTSLEMLPAGKHPIVAFMGVKTGGKSAVFYVADSGYRATGEGSCRSAGCRFFELSTSDTRNEETISSTDGRIGYTLQLKAIHFKSVDKSGALGNSTPAKKAAVKKASSGKPRAAATGKPRTRTFMTLPQLGFATG